MRSRLHGRWPYFRTPRDPVGSIFLKYFPGVPDLRLNLAGEVFGFCLQIQGLVKLAFNLISCSPCYWKCFVR